MTITLILWALLGAPLFPFLKWEGYIWWGEILLNLILCGPLLWGYVVITMVLTL